MSFSTQLLLWAVAVAAVAGWVVEPIWRGRRPPTVRVLALGAQGVVTLVWASSLGFFAVTHLAYLLATVVPVGPVVAAFASQAGRARLDTWAGRGLAAALLVPPLLGLYATHIEPFWLRVDRVDVAVDAGDGLRIGVLADLQTRDIGEHERDAVATLIDQRPDLVLVPGDLWQTDDDVIAESWGRWADLIAELVDAVGTVVIVEGNTDHIGWIELIAEASGAVVVHDRVARFEIDGTTVVIGGTRDLATVPAAPSLRAMEALVAAESDDVVTIALTHRPDIIEWLPGRVDLIVTGHTHGGQIQLPFIGPLITASSVPRHVAAGGLSDIDGHRIYVSTGVGLERSDAPQVRFGVRPSVGVLDLVVADR
ncbi:MAG: metallophosphoesterase [Actinomycetota bacterium]